MRVLIRVALAALLTAAASGCPTPSPACSPSTCNGCCDASGACRGGSEPIACGSAGFSCSACAIGAVCVTGTCVNGSGGGTAGGSAGGVGGGTAGGSAGGAAGGTAGGTGGGTGGGTAGGTGGGTAGGTGGGTAGGTGGGTAGGTGGGTAGGSAGGTGGGASIDCSVPPFIDWGTVANYSATTRDLVLDNPTNATIVATVGPVTSSSGDDVAFPAGTTGSVSVPPQSTQVVTFTFQPTVVKAYAAFVTLRRAPSCPDLPIGLRGNAIDYVLGWSPPTPDFGYVPPGATVQLDVVFTNLGTAPAVVSNLVVTGAEFHLVGSVTSLPVAGNGGTATLTLSFTPALLGPRLGQLSFSTNVSGQPTGTMSLRGYGGGPSIRVTPDPLDFGQVAYFAGAVPPSSVARSLNVSNIGTRPSPPNVAANLRLGRVINGVPGQLPYFSLRALNANTSTAEFGITLNPAYVPSVGLEAGSSTSQTDFEVRLTPVTAGAKSVELTLYSNDLVTPDRTVTLSGNAVVLPPCSFALDAAALSFGLVAPGTVRQLAVTFTNTGSAACVVSGVDLATGSNPAFALVGGPIAQLTLQPGEARMFPVEVAPTGPVPTSLQNVTGSLRFQVSSPTTPVASVPLDAQIGMPCLVLTPSALDFGTAARTCSSLTRTVQAWNVCSTTITITSTAMVQPAGEPAGGPNCPGTSACPEFLSVSGLTPNTVLNAGTGVPLTFSLKYHPLNLGPDHGAFRLAVTQNGVPVGVVLPLRGGGDTAGLNVDTMANPAVPQADVLLVIDDSGSMTDKQVALGQNLSSLLTYAVASGVDYQIGVTTADMSAAAGRLVGTPAVFTSTTPNLLTQLGTRVNVGYSGSGVEETLSPTLAACTAPLVTADNAGFVRRPASLGVLAVSDADDQSPLPVSYYVSRLQDLKPPGAFTWSAMAPLLSTPPASCVYDGTGGAPRASAAAGALGGGLGEICTANWAGALQQVGKTMFGYRTRWYLTAIPDVSGVVVRVNGTVLPALDGRGQPVWTLDVPTHSVNFEPVYVPAPGDAVTFTYSVPCAP